MKNFIIFGLKNSGKTVLGKALANKLGLNFIDIDSLIENNYLKIHQKPLSYKDIYINHGVNFFRSLEKKTILSLRPDSKSIISLGGGSLIDSSIHENIKKLGSLIYLDITFPTFAFRLDANYQNKNQILFLGKMVTLKKLKKIYDERSEILKKFPSLMIKTDNKTYDEILMEITNGIK